MAYSSERNAVLECGSGGHCVVVPSHPMPRWKAWLYRLSVLPAYVGIPDGDDSLPDDDA